MEAELVGSLPNGGWIRWKSTWWGLNWLEVYLMEAELVGSLPDGGWIGWKSTWWMLNWLEVYLMEVELVGSLPDGGWIGWKSTWWRLNWWSTLYLPPLLTRLQLQVLLFFKIFVKYCIKMDGIKKNKIWKGWGGKQSSPPPPKYAAPMKMLDNLWYICITYVWNK